LGGENLTDDTKRLAHGHLRPRLREDKGGRSVDGHMPRGPHTGTRGIVSREEKLLFAGVEGCDHEIPRLGETQSERLSGHRLKGAHADERSVEAEGHTFGGGDTDAYASEGARADIGGEGGEVVRLEPGLVEGLLDGGEDTLGGAAFEVYVRRGAEHTLAVEDGGAPA